MRKIKYIDVDIPIIIDNNYKFKSCVDEKWKFADNIYRDYVYNVNDDNSNDYKYVAKVLKIDNREADRVRNELIISKLMSDEGIGPKVYDMSLNENEGIIIMNKFDGNLHQLMSKYKTNKNIKMLDIINVVSGLTKKMHSLNIFHGDLHLRNILYSNSGDIAISDFGNSLYTTSQELKDSELINLDGFKKIYQLINEDSLEFYYEDTIDNIMFDVTCISSPYNFNFTWNGTSCEWYG